MRIEEITLIKVTFPKKKVQKALDSWNLQRHPRLAMAIERVLRTGKEEYHREDVFLYHVKPEFPLIPSAMDEDNAKNSSRRFMKVGILVFTLARTMGVRDEPEKALPQDVPFPKRDRDEMTRQDEDRLTVLLESPFGVSKVRG